jgi:Predicted membrane protein (DUF2142)
MTSSQNPATPGTTTIGATTPGTRRHRSRVSSRIFVVVLALFFVVIAAQSVATPRNAGPDEPAHLIRSAGLVRGDALGTASDSGEAVRSFDAPAWAGQPDPGCYAFEPETAASCATVIEAKTSPTSSAGSYQIWAHILPGIATLLPGAAKTVWISRLLGAIPPAVLIAAALTRLVRDGKRLESAALCVAMTPMALFSIAVVNPSGLAIGGAVALWVGGLNLAAQRPGYEALVAVGWAASMLARGDGLMWCAVIGGLILALRRESPRRFVALLSTRARLLMIGSTVAAVGWTLAVQPALVDDPEPTTGLDRLTKMLGETGQHLTESIGVVGWLDTTIPTTMIYLWTASLGVILGVALLGGARRSLGALGVGAALLVAIPWVLEWSQASQAGLFWQGRYGLPLFVGLIIAVGHVAAGSVDAVRRGTLLSVLGSATWLVWNVSLLQQVRRWSVGANGSALPWEWDVGIGVAPTLGVITVHMVASGLLLAVVVGPATLAGRLNSLQTKATARNDIY